ncbi:hypothetical protein D915_000342 [Fasciola hepatica]|uniref:Uncharacterized protein n=1 Tax=Fasciola hepatica TaxID=6192 RepID=A0A4E0S469_FASHE|nr:hypothetical protein D915_000342 [Fasciola hepatica]
MRWCEVLFTIGKWACSTVGTLIAFVYFSNKPPISQIFPSIILIAFLLCYLTASIVVGILQIKLAFLTEDKQARSSWPSLSIRRPRFSAEKRQQTRNHDKSVLHSDRLGHFDEISV